MPRQVSSPARQPEYLSGPVFLGIGSNLGDRTGFVREGLVGLEDRGVIPRLVSSLYDTEPMGMHDQGNFINLVVEVEFRGAPQSLLEQCQAVETSLGRTRGIPDGPRTLDIDILLVGQRVIEELHLQVPHPRLAVRRFVLVPLAEIAPGTVHPLLKLTPEALLAQCPDFSEVRRLSERLHLEWLTPSSYNPAASRGIT